MDGELTIWIQTRSSPTEANPTTTTGMELYITATRIYLGLLSGKPERLENLFQYLGNPLKVSLFLKLSFAVTSFLVHLTASGQRRVNLQIPGRHVYGGKWWLIWHRFTALEGAKRYQPHP